MRIDGFLWVERGWRSGWLVIGLLGVSFLFFSSFNNSNDAFMYAADVRWGVDLFYPHHLLFNLLGYALTWICPWVEPLRLLCLMNGVFALGCLVCLRRLLRFLQVKSLSSVLLLVGTSWGFIRYATEAETYIVPLFFSLLASCCLVDHRTPFWVSFWAAVACLFHQIHFLWWLGLASFFLQPSFSGRRLRCLLQYLAAGCVVPLIYGVVFAATDTGCEHLLQFMFHDYLYVENVGFFWQQAFLLTPINALRTWVQVHGYIYPLLLRFPFLGLGVILFVLGFIYFLWRCSFSRRKLSSDHLGLARVHGLIFILHLLFAWASNGNAEFMVMLPFAFAIWFFAHYRLARLVSLACGLLAWNFTVGLWPYHALELYPYRAIERELLAHPERIYYVANYPQIYNMLRYDAPDRTEQLLEQLPSHGTIYTDCWDNAALFSRAALTSETVSPSDLGWKRADYALNPLLYDLGEWNMVVYHR